ncbi:MAG: queuosine precursor transporter [Alphaproteobacteria bacterium]|nr:queuosine precursor transporter [Alphaproteobacteria bacterium]OJV13692.1 MAG: hypothetical protein BGO27_00780 [Alphaproteobacteria bacterium 33-17]
MNDFGYRTKIYIVLLTLFCSCLILGNIIFKKFTSFSIFGIDFELSVGALTYPITFIFTDLISEFYGKQKSDFAVKCGVISSLFVALLLMITNTLPSTSWSYISKDEYNKMFGLYEVVFGASILSNYLAQKIDIRIYLFFKDLTKGKYIWLRNNASTIVSQITDSVVIYSLMLYLGTIPNGKFFTVFSSAILFKIMFSLICTPFYYMAIFACKILLDQTKLKNHK